MAVLSFKVQADYDKVVRLREEIAKLETQLKGFGKNTPLVEIKAVETRLAEAKTEFTSVATEAAKAGAAIDKDFKGRIKESTKVVDGLTMQIIEQKAVIKDHEYNVKKLGDAYRNALKRDSSSAASIKTELDAAKRVVDEEKASLFALTQEKAKATLATKKLKEEYAEFKEEAKETSKESEAMGLSLGKIAGLVGGVAALKQLGSAVVQVRGQFQDMETSIKTLVGEDMTSKLMPQIKELAKTSPLTMTDIVGAEKMMLGFNIEAEKTIDFLKALSDVSMGSSQKFNSLTLAFSQMSASGKLMGQDLNQMINAGFNPLQQISEKTGKSIAQLKVEMSKGAISAEMVQQAFLDATSAGGKFYNMSENASKTINGQISMMQDAIDAALNEIGTKSEGIIMKGIQATTSLIQNYETVGKVLVGLVATYGIYKAAVFAAIAADEGLAAAKAKLTVVTAALEKAQNALKASMLANPFVAFTTVVVATTAAIVAYERSANFAKKSQRELNDALEEAQEASMGELRGLAALKGELAACEKGTDNYNKVKAKIVSGYGKYYEGLEKEIEEVGLLDETYKKLTESISAAFSARQYDRFLKEQESDLDKQVSKNLNNIYERLTKDLGDEKGAEVYAKVRDAIMSGAELDKDVTKILNDVQDKGKLNADSRIDNWIRDARERLKGFEKIREEAKVRFGIKDSDLNSNTPDKTTPKKPMYSEEYEAAKKKYEADLAAFKEVETNKTKFTTEEYNKRKQALQSSEEAFKKLGGKTDKSSKKTAEEIKKAGENQREVDKRVAREREKQQEDLDNKLDQIKINNEKDRSKAVRMQMELDNRMEIQQLEREREAYVEAYVKAEKDKFEAQESANKAGNENYVKKSFDDSAAREAAMASDAYKRYGEIISETKKQQTNDQLEAERQANNEYLSQYGTYLEKKKALTEKYQDLINKATTEGEKKTLETERDKLLRDLDNSMSKAYQNIFKDPSKMSLSNVKDAIKLAREEIKKITDKGVLNEEDMQNVKILQEALDRLQEYATSSPFAGFGDGLDGVISKLNDIRVIKKRIENAEKSGNAKEKADAESELEASKELLAKNLAGVGVDAFANGLSTAAEAMRQIADISGDPQLARTADILNGTANVVTSVAQGAATGGWIGALVGGATAVLSEVTTAIMDMQIAMVQNEKAMDEYKHAMKMLAVSIDEDVYDTIWGESTFARIDELNKKLAEAKKEMYGVSADRSQWKRQNVEFDNIEEARKYVESLRERDDVTDVEWGYIDDKIVATAKFFTHAAQTLANAKIKKKGEEETLLGSMFQGLFDESGNLRLDKIEEAKAALKSLSDMSLEETEGVDLLDEAIQYGEKVVEYQNSLKEAAANYMGSIGDSLGDAIVNGILKGEDALENFNDVAGGIIEQIAKDFAASWMIDNYLKTFEGDMQDAFLSGNAADITKVVGDIVAGLPDVLEASEEATKQILDMTKGTDYDLYEKYAEGGSQQEASRKGYGTLSEDTGNELVGRATAQYESNLRMEDAMRMTKESVDIMAANQVQIRDIASESREIIASSYLELVQIRENTGAIIKPILNLSNKLNDWNDKIMGL